MRWRTGRRSTRIEDRRGSSPRFRGRRGLAGGGIGTIVLVLVALYFGVDPSLLLQGGMTPGPSSPGGTYTPTPEEQELKEFVAVVLGSTEDAWTARFEQGGETYQAPVLVLFSGTVQSACGFAQSATGPFYCPGDRQVYIDLSFYNELRNRFGAPGDTAQAYVIAHEVGHHVQTLLGISEKVHAARRRVSEAEANQLSVRQELQADCFAGLWAWYVASGGINADVGFESGDIDEALTAAAAIGDDRIQKQTRGYVTPDSFTHGSSQQRVRWFRKGLESGRMETCDTFSAASL